MISLIILYHYTYRAINKIFYGECNSAQVILLNSKNLLNIDLEKYSIKTPSGILCAVKDHKYPEHDDDGNLNILLDSNKIMSSYKAVVVSNLQILNDIILIIAIGGGDSGKLAFSIVDIKPDKSFIVHNDFVGLVDNVPEFSQSGKCINAKVPDPRLYADKTDYLLFKYCIDGSEKEYDSYKFIKSDDYYRGKFSSYTSKQIYDTAVSDKCLNTKNNQFYTSDTCIGGEKYCFMFNSKIQKESDNYTERLNNVCQNK